MNVAAEESIVVEKERIVIIGARMVILGIGEALLKPVITKPRSGLNKVPPLIGEVLHVTVRRRHEQRSVRIQRG